MSGIAGIIRFDGAPVEPGLIEKMTAAMHHRGPDGIRHWVKGSVALGQCMLRTTPESLEEHLPLATEDGDLVLVMDGRVDNWEELRRDLLARGAVLRTRADAELVLRAYERWGRECLLHIDGDFALVIWDARRREAFCARDRTGKKTFTYHWDGKTLSFASELHAILTLPWVREELNEGVLAEYLTFQWFSREETFWRGIRRLVAAHEMSVGAGGPRPQQYWMPDCWATLPYTRDEEYIEHYRELFADVVRRMSRLHLPVGFEVSGGLDSSAIFAMAEHLRRAGRLPAERIDGYSLAFVGAPEAEERRYSRAVGDHLGVPIHEHEATRKPPSWYRGWADRYREFPGYPNGIMAIGLREAVRQRGSRVLMSGPGGDEWLDTWPGAQYAEELAAANLRGVRECFMADCGELGVGRLLWHLARFGVAPLLPEGLKEASRRVLRRGPSRPRWLSAKLEAEIEKRRGEARGGLPARLRMRSQRARLSTLWSASSIVAWELEERLAASLGLELRYPYYNKDIVQFAVSTPDRLRSRGNVTKWFHRRAMAGLLPELVIDRPDKAEFSVTFRWRLDSIVNDLQNDVLTRRLEWLDRRCAMAVCDDYLESPTDSWSIWLLCGLVGCDALLSPTSRAD